MRKIDKLDGRYGNLINKKLLLEKIQIDGQLRDNQSDFYQLIISTKNEITVSVDGYRYQRDVPNERIRPGISANIFDKGLQQHIDSSLFRRHRKVDNLYFRRTGASDTR